MSVQGDFCMIKINVYYFSDFIDLIFIFYLCQFFICVIEKLQ